MSHFDISHSNMPVVQELGAFRLGAQALSGGKPCMQSGPVSDRTAHIDGNFELSSGL